MVEDFFLPAMGWCILALAGFRIGRNAFAIDRRDDDMPMPMPMRVTKAHPASPVAPSATVAKSKRPWQVPFVGTPVVRMPFVKAAFVAAAMLALASAPKVTRAGVVIEVDFSGGGLTPTQQAYFSVAADYWESLIVDYIGGFNPLLGSNIDDGDGRIEIFASGADLGGVGGVLGQAGPTTVAGFVGGNFLYVAQGLMQFDTHDLPGMESSNTLMSVIMHEMAHVLGLGTMWDPFTDYNIAGFQDVYDDGAKAYTGANALNEWKTEFSQASATFVPIEAEGQAGTFDSHWNEVAGGAALTGITDTLGRDMRDELMTGWLNAPSFLSRMSVAQFADIGYVVDFSNLAFVNANINNAVTVPEPTSLVALATVALIGYRHRRKRLRRGSRSTPR
jgi:hypothetical protein